MVGPKYSKPRDRGLVVIQAKKAVAGLAGAAATAALGAASFGSPVAAATVSPTDKADVIVAAAACVGPNAVSTGEMLVDGNPVQWGDGKVNLPGGSTVTVNFTVAAGCDATKFGLAAYSDPVGNPDPTFQEVEKQTLAVSATTTKSGGQSGTLTVNLPAIMDCFYQVDFFTGNVITAFTPGNYYGSPEHRLIAVTHIEKPDCNEVSNTTTTRAPETTTTTVGVTTTTASVGNQEVTTTTSRSGVTTTTGAEVLDTNIVADSTTTTTEGAQVLAESLARTGANSLPLLGAAGAFALLGGALSAGAAALRRRRATSSD